MLDEKSRVAKQLELKKLAIEKNGGECETYYYCRYCEEPTSFKRKNDMPCADAWKKAIEKRRPQRKHILRYPSRH